MKSDALRRDTLRRCTVPRVAALHRMLCRMHCIALRHGIYGAAAGVVTAAAIRYQPMSELYSTTTSERYCPHSVKFHAESRDFPSSSQVKLSVSRELSGWGVVDCMDWSA